MLEEKLSTLLMDKLVILGLVINLFVHHVRGSTYAVAMLGLEIQTDGTSSSNTYEAVMINTGTEPVTVNIETIEGMLIQETVDPSSTKPFVIPISKVMNGSEIANKTLIFSSSDDFKLQVFSTSSGAHSEGLLGIPIEDLSGPHQIDNVYEYVVTTFCATSGFCQFAVTSHQMVDLKITFPGHVNDIVFCIGMRYFRSWRDTVISLDKFDAVQIESTRDLTGTHIYSTGGPIVVYVGSRNITAGSVLTHMLEQLTPSSHWGTKFGATTLGQNGYGDILKIAATWSNTLVKMQGFPNFVISNRSHVVSRRLDRNMMTYIEASNPIQVIQITGLTYATANATGSAAMTTLPAVEHASNSTTVTCGSSATAADFLLFTRKGAAPPTVEGVPVTEKGSIMYWDHTIYNHSSSALSTFTVDGQKVFGVVKCDGNSVFPLTTQSTNNITVTEEQVNTAETCIEGQTASTTYEYDQLPVPVVRSLNGMEVIKLRVQVCGEALIQFDQGSNSVVVRLSEQNIYFDLCHADTCERRLMGPDSFNVDMDCEKDMAVYWFKQRQQNSTSLLLCFGTGPIHDRTDDCTNSSIFQTHFNTDSGQLFETFSVVGLHSDAFFLIDLEPSAGCSVHVSDWRCEDKLRNCSSYGTSACNSTSSTYTQFVTDACRKHCGQCGVDSYGEKFLVLFQKVQDNPDYLCYLYVSATASHVPTYVSASTTTQLLTARNLSDNQTWEFDCSTILDELVFVRSNENVAVTVFYWIEEKVLTNIVYPVDSFGMEYMPFSIEVFPVKTFCKLVSEDLNVRVVPYFGDFNLEADDSPITDGTEFVLSFLYTDVTNNGPKLSSAVLFIADKPIGVFCGNWINSGNSNADNFNQMLPTEAWGTLYRIPALSQSMVDRPFNGELKVQAYMANTFVHIDGDFTSNYTLTSIGQIESIAVNLGHYYVIQTNYPVAVAIYLNDATDSHGGLSSFHIIPPVPSFDRDPQIFSPVGAIGVRFTNFGTLLNMTSYFASHDGSYTHVTAADLSGNFYRNTQTGSVWGLTVGIGTGNKWFVIPTVSSIVSSTITEPTCIISSTVPNDNIDNDCDNLIDEDVCYSGYGVYGNDYDIDGDFNDDCETMVTEPVVVVKDEDPVCLVIDKPADQCWTVCECKCSWVANYQLMQNMTTEEFQVFRQEKSAIVQEVLAINSDELSSSEAKLVSAEDERQSAANIGYVGIALFTIVFGTIIILDVSALLRDMRTFGNNFRAGMKRCWNHVRCKK